MINKFDLRRVYGDRYWEDAARIWEEKGHLLGSQKRNYLDSSHGQKCQPGGRIGPE